MQNADARRWHPDRTLFLLVVTLVAIGLAMVYSASTALTLDQGVTSFYFFIKQALAAVVGVPDTKSGEMVKAYIQLKPGETATEEEILAFCKENMAGYKRPKIVEFRETLPVSNVGKILRRVLRDEEKDKSK